MPNSDTFDIEPIHNFVRKYLYASKVSVDPFARNKQWATYTNDLNPNTSADYHMEALEFIEHMSSIGVTADLAIFDPPYSYRQVAECYESVGREFTQQDHEQVQRWSMYKDAIASILTNDATVLSFGWNSTGMGKTRGFEAIELLLVNHGSAHNDTICLAERRSQKVLQFDPSA
jgi:hypothetical protein